MTKIYNIEILQNVLNMYLAKNEYTFSICHIFLMTEGMKFYL